LNMTSFLNIFRIFIIYEDLAPAAIVQLIISLK
jgi:hypothetical protein